MKYILIIFILLISCVEKKTHLHLTNKIESSNIETDSVDVELWYTGGHKLEQVLKFPKNGYYSLGTYNGQPALYIYTKDEKLYNVVPNVIHILKINKGLNL